MKTNPQAIEIANRDQAIFEAINSSQSGDIVLIAGKGHENYQIIGNKKIYFSDHAEVMKSLG